MNSESCCISTSKLCSFAKYKFSFPYVSTRWRSVVNVLSRLQMESEASTLTSSGERVKYLRDPRPHFGIAHSSRSVSFPLWDSDRPREMKEGEDDEEEEEEKGVDSVSCCPHCHLGLPRDTLRWHEVTRHTHMLLYFTTTLLKVSIIIAKEELNINIKVMSFVIYLYFFLFSCAGKVSVV